MRQLCDFSTDVDVENTFELNRLFTGDFMATRTPTLHAASRQEEMLFEQPFTLPQSEQKIETLKKKSTPNIVRDI